MASNATAAVQDGLETVRIEPIHDPHEEFLNARLSVPRNLRVDFENLIQIQEFLEAAPENGIAWDDARDHFSSTLSESGHVANLMWVLYRAGFIEEIGASISSYVPAILRGHDGGAAVLKDSQQWIATGRKGWAIVKWPNKALSELLKDLSHAGKHKKLTL